MTRVEVFIDGFNLYYGMRDNNKTHSYRKILWLDLVSFVKKHLIKPDETLENIYYFTAEPMKDRGKIIRHKNYCKALTDSGVKIIYGKYKTKKLSCPLCCNDFDSFEEKETDVNIALSLLRRGVENGYDKALLFSGDSDLAPAIENAKALFPQKIYQVVFPINRNRSKRLKQVSDIVPIYQYLPSYKACQFLPQIILKNGNIVECPKEWK